MSGLVGSRKKVLPRSQIGASFRPAKRSGERPRPGRSMSIPPACYRRDATSSCGCADSSADAHVGGELCEPSQSEGLRHALYSSDSDVAARAFATGGESNRPPPFDAGASRRPIRHRRFATMKVRRTRNVCDPDWLQLRSEFIPDRGLDENRQFLTAFEIGRAHV